MPINNMDIWNSLNRPPASALKQIGFGPMKGKSSIQPQWRIKAMTEQFGPVGVGWKYEIVRLWTEPAADGQVFAFAQINVFWKDDTNWSDPIPGIGGNLLMSIVKRGKPEERMELNDEAFKMAVTDAMGVAMKALGVAADVYADLWDGSKWCKAVDTNPEDPAFCTAQQASTLRQTAKVLDHTESGLTAFIEWYRKGEKLTYDEANELIDDYKTHFAKYSEDVPI